MNLKKNINGFTLIEVLVALAVASIVITIICVLYASFRQSYTVQDVSAGVQQSVRAGMEFMIREIRQAGYEPKIGDDFGIEEGNGTKIRFTMDTVDNSLSPPDYNGIINDGSSERITYEYDSGNRQLVRITDEGKDSEFKLVVLDNVDTLSFSYFDKSENVLGVPVSASSLADIRGVDITLTLQEPAGRDNRVLRTITQRVLCRNMGLE